MDPLTISAAGGMQARLESLDMLANNLANTETGGYKTDREFYNIYVSAESASEEPAPALPVIERPWTDFSAGALRTTGAPLDLALTGNGFFAVDGPGGSLYTRNGGFRVSPSGMLVTGEGYAVRTVSGGHLQVAPAGAVEVAEDGAVRQNGQALGRLDIAAFADNGVLAKQGSSYFQSAAAPQAASNVRVEQGKLEGSNVGAAESAVRLVAVMRQFEMLQKAAQLGSQMNRESVEEVAKVAS
ncbi:MAG: flagellar basal-body rod protein FlgF [Bryobacteraceae bacterium]|jgi:flagellar basal-body rod protein FlgF